MSYSLKTRILSIATVVLLVSAQMLFAGGGKDAAPGGKQKGPANAAEANLKLSNALAEPVTLPIVKDKISISYLSFPELYVISKMKGYADMEVIQELERKTNVNIKWREESYTDPKPKMNLILSTGEPEDVMWDVHLHAAGGAKKVMDDGLIIPLNWYIEHYAPNLKKLLLENKQLLKEISLDDGRIFMFPEIRYDAGTRSNNGFALRKDWLDKLGLKSPTTVDEWYTVLKAFKEKDPNGNGKKDEIPFVSLPHTSDSWSFAPFAGAFGFVDNVSLMYLDGSQVKLAAFNTRYKEYIATMAKWYAEGLLDPEYASSDSRSIDAKMTNNIGGSYYGALSGGLGKYLNAGVRLVPTHIPLAADGKYYVGVAAYKALVPHGAAIGKNNKRIIETIKWMDYHYTPEARDMLNFGIEGRAHTRVNGEHKFTDLIMKNPDGLTLEEACARYAGGTIVQMPGFDLTAVNIQIKNAHPEQTQASRIWEKSNTSKIVPQLYLPSDKTQEAARITSEIRTYIEESINKFIMGKDSLDNFDKFIVTLKNLKADTLVQYYNDAYQTWLKD